jgi:hypothetical protein
MCTIGDDFLKKEYRVGSDTAAHPTRRRPIFLIDLFLINLFTGQVNVGGIFNLFLFLSF